MHKTARHTGYVEDHKDKKLLFHPLYIKDFPKFTIVFVTGYLL